MKRIVTTNDANGRSTILIEDEIGPHAQILETADGEPFGRRPLERLQDLDFSKGQCLARYLEIPPDAVMAEYLKRGIPGLDENGFHRTGTLDYFVLLEGCLTLELDDGKAELHPGDVVVQRDTRHAWRNSSESPARCFVVVIYPADPT
jgi:mannose-6-phosphate isomerase-like protein (cupin superfamily)